MMCPKCQKQVPEGGKFCRFCGSPVVEAPVVNTERPKKKKKWVLIALISLVLVAAIVVGAIAILGAGKETVMVACERYYYVHPQNYENTTSWGYEFDDDGNLESYAYAYTYHFEGQEPYDQEVEISLEYDEKGRIETVTVEQLDEEFEFEYIYDGNDLVEIEAEIDQTSLLATCEDGLVVLVEMENDGGEAGTIEFEYDDDGNLISYIMEVDGEKVMEKAYDENGKVILIANYQDGELIARTAYEYDEHGSEVRMEYTAEHVYQLMERDISYDEDGRIEAIELTITVEYEGEEPEVQKQTMEYDWESDTQATITYSGDNVGESYCEETYDEEGNMVSSTVYQDGEPLTESEYEYTYMELTSRQQRQLDQVRWLVALYGGGV